MKIHAHIKPNSKHDEGVFEKDGVYEIRVKAPAVEGKANARAVELLAIHFGTSKTKVRLVRGATSKQKTFEIESKTINNPSTSISFRGIDTTRDFTVGLNGKDPDAYSADLRNHHKLLWSKVLPNGKLFYLLEAPQNRLVHKSETGEFVLSSDRAINTFSRWGRMENVVSQIPTEKIMEFRRITETIGAIMIWPSNKVNGKPTINGERGFNSKICDRLDLTIECVRRFYKNEPSPLYDTLKRYEDFFRLFSDFRGYVDFFLLQDFVSENYDSVIISPPFDNFQSRPTPKNKEEYEKYMNMTVKSINARNDRIRTYADKHGL